jgi:putative tryptophan/tyrosine transport system substrate-binding protein
MDRRTFMSSVTLGLLTAPLAAAAQQAGKMARVGYLSTGERLSPVGEVFPKTLSEYGWVEGQNLVMQYRFGGEQYERLDALARDLARLQVDVIFAASAPAARAAKAATTRIPIVFHTLNDPVRAGLVASFARPGGNMTGNAGRGPELDQKRIEVLKELVPSLSAATVLVNPSNPMTPPRLSVIETTGRALRIQILVLTASNAKGLDDAFQAMVRSKPAGLIVFEDPIFALHRQRIIDFARNQRLPTVYSQSDWAVQGALIEYAPNQREMFRQAAGYVDRILRGVKPADLPIQQPTKYELVINLKTAKALGLTIPPSLLQRADQVIE